MANVYFNNKIRQTLSKNKNKFENELCTFPSAACVHNQMLIVDVYIQSNEL